MNDLEQVDERWQLLVAGAREMMAKRQPETYAQFGLDFTMQYEWNLDRAEIVFASNRVPIVRADLQFVGSIAGRNRTWMWGWANKSIPTQATVRLSEVRRYGEAQGFYRLTDAEWVPQDDDGHDVMIVAACILGAPAIFHDHAGSLAQFFLLDGFQRL